MSDDIFKTEVLGDDIHMTKLSSSNIEPDEILNKPDFNPEKETSYSFGSSQIYRRDKDRRTP